MRREAVLWFRIVAAALIAALTAVLVLSMMVVGCAVSYDPVLPDGSIDNAPARALGGCLVGLPGTVLFAFVLYPIAFSIHPPVRAFSLTHLLWVFSLTLATSLFLEVSVWDSFARWYEGFLAATVLSMLLLLPLEVGFLAAGVVGLRHTKLLRPARTTERLGTGSREVASAPAAERQASGELVLMCFVEERR